MNRMRTQTKQEITFMRKIQNSKHHTTKNPGSTVGLTLLILKRYHVEKNLSKYIYENNHTPDLLPQ